MFVRYLRMTHFTEKKKKSSRKERRQLFKFPHIDHKI